MSDNLSKAAQAKCFRRARAGGGAKKWGALKLPTQKRQRRYRVIEIPPGRALVVSCPAEIR
jgi:hypothetical protein